VHPLPLLSPDLSLLLPFYPHPFSLSRSLSLSLSLVLYLSLSLSLPLANTEADNGKERRRTSNTVFTTIIIFASYLGPASSYLPFRRGTRAAPASSPISLSLSFTIRVSLLFLPG